MQDTPQDPFDSLMNAASDKSLWVLIGGPAGLLILIAIVYLVLISIRRRKEARELKQAVEEEGGKESVKALGETQDDEDFDALTPSPEIDDSAPYLVPTKVDLLPEPEEDAGETEVLNLETEEVVAPPPSDIDEIRRTDRASWLERLRRGLSRSRDALQGSLSALFKGSVKIDQTVLERLHEALYRADIGVATADKLVAAVKTTLGKEEAANWESVAACLKAEAKTILKKSQVPYAKPEKGPFVILVVGVNGVGKTTSIGKLTAHFLADDKKVLLAAGDTFRAAAIEQLEIWGQRLGVDVVRHKQGADPAAVAYDGVKAAISRNVDVLLIDTAGRLHNKNELMAELGKVNRVIGKDLPGAPHATWLVIDATTGQNAVAQVKAFKEVVGLTGLIVTKLDGTAKGGVLIGIVDQFGLPIHYVGVGEKAADLRSFDVDDYVDSLF